MGKIQFPLTCAFFCLKTYDELLRKMLLIAAIRKSPTATDNPISLIGAGKAKDSKPIIPAIRIKIRLIGSSVIGNIFPQQLQIFIFIDQITFEWNYPKGTCFSY